MSHGIYYHSIYYHTWLISGRLVEFFFKNRNCFFVEAKCRTFFKTFFFGSSVQWTIHLMWSMLRGERKWVERNGSNRPPVPWVESSPFRNWVEWTWVDLEKCQVLGRQHIDFDPIPFDPIRPQSIRPKLFDQKGRPNSFRPISFDPFHAIQCLAPILDSQRLYF